MDKVFRPYLKKFVLVFFDDILVYSKDLEDQLKHLEIVLTVLKDNELYANGNKCQFAIERIAYLGHLVSGKGVEGNLEKLRAMLEWPVPTTMKEVCGFLGLTGYYWRFVQHYGSIVAPLMQVLKQGNFEWDEEAQKAFETLKKAMMSFPMLALPDFNCPFEVEIDASGCGVGVVLAQKRKPIDYFSHTLSLRDQGKLVYERELMAVVMAIRRWRPYLMGRRFVVRRDQRALKYLLEETVIQPKYQNWVLLGYDFEVQYWAGVENQAADAFSRVPPTMHLAYLTTPSLIDIQRICQEVSEDSKLKEIIEKLALDEDNTTRFALHQGVLRYKGRIVLSKSSTLIPTILHTYHDSVFGGHLGFFRTYKRQTGELYWEDMKADVKKYVEECTIYQKNKSMALSPAGLLISLGILNVVWEDITMDFVEGLPRARGHHTILVVVDRLSKYSHFIGLQHPLTTKTVAEVFIREIIKLHGFPRSIVSNRDKVFLSNFWKELFKAVGTRLHRSTTYHPQTNGQMEVVNRCLETYLRCLCGERPKEWSDWFTLG